MFIYSLCGIFACMLYPIYPEFPKRNVLNNFMNLIKQNAYNYKITVPGVTKRKSQKSFINRFLKMLDLKYKEYY